MPTIRRNSIVTATNPTKQKEYKRKQYRDIKVNYKIRRRRLSANTTTAAHKTNPTQFIIKKQKQRKVEHPLMKLIRGKKVKFTEKKKFCIIQNRGLLYSFRCLRGPSEEYLKEKQIILDNSLGMYF